MTSLNNIIDTIGDTISDTILSNTLTSSSTLPPPSYYILFPLYRLEQVMKDYRQSPKKQNNTSFNDILYTEKHKYVNNYNLKTDELKQALINKKILKLKMTETDQNINTLIIDIKNMPYKPSDYDIDDELTQLLK